MNGTYCTTKSMDCSHNLKKYEDSSFTRTGTVLQQIRTKSDLLFDWVPAYSLSKYIIG